MNSFFVSTLNAASSARTAANSLLVSTWKAAISDRRPRTRPSPRLRGPEGRPGSANRPARPRQRPPTAPPPARRRDGPAPEARAANFRVSKATGGHGPDPIMGRSDATGAAGCAPCPYTPRRSDRWAFAPRRCLRLVAGAGPFRPGRGPVGAARRRPAQARAAGGADQGPADVIVDVGGEAELSAGLQHPGDLGQGFRRDEAALALPALRPGIG